MGWITSLLIVTVPVSGCATLLAFRLGDKLPIACRQFGRNIGMGYNYFKVILKLLSPETSSPAEIVDLIRKSDQQSAALSREIKESLMRVKYDAKAALPQEFIENPMNLLRIQPDVPLTNPTDNITGSSLLDVAFKERKRIIERKREKKAKSTFTESI